MKGRGTDEVSPLDEDILRLMAGEGEAVILIQGVITCKLTIIQ